MFVVLESLLLKGDISLEKQLQNNDFNPESNFSLYIRIKQHIIAMFRLFGEVRRQIVVRIEEAEHF